MLNVYYKLSTLVFLFTVLIGVAPLVGQTTYYSDGSGDFSTLATWKPASDGSGLAPGAINATDDFVIEAGDVVTITGDIEVNSLTIYSGATLQITSGGGPVDYTLTLNGDFITQGTFTVSAGGNNLNVVMQGSSTTVLSGSGTIVFNDLTFQGGANRIISTQLNVDGNFLVTGAGTTVNTAVNNIYVAGNFTVDADGVFKASDGVLWLDGAAAQSLTVNTTGNRFDRIYFDNGGSIANVKTLNSDLVFNDEVRIYDDAWVRTNGAVNLTFRNTFRTYNSDAGSFDMQGGTFSMTGGTILYDDITNTNEDGVVRLYNTSSAGAADVTYSFQATSIQEGDQVIVDGNVTLTDDPEYGLWFIINGTDSGTARDGQLTDFDGSHTFTVSQDANFYPRGYNNFPVSFASHVFETGSDTYYDSNFDQLVYGSEGARTFSYSNLNISQAAGSAFTKTLVANNQLDINGDFRLTDDVTFDFNGSTLSHTIEDDWTNDANDPASIIGAQAATVTLDGVDNNQTVQLAAAPFVFRNFNINVSGLTAVRTIFIDNPIEVVSGGSVTMTNTGGSSSNYLIVDIDNIQFNGNGAVDGSRTFTVNSHVKVYSSNSAADPFVDLQDFSVTFNTDATIRFDGNNQTIPGSDIGFPLTAIEYWNIEITGTGTLTIAANKFVRVNGDFVRPGSSMNVVMVPGSDGSFNPFYPGYTGTLLNVKGDFDVGIGNTSFTAPAAGEFATILLDGADQIVDDGITAYNLVFGGTGTKSLNGDFDIENDLTINDGVTVNSTVFTIDIAGDWIENSGTFTQTTGNVYFDGTAQSITQQAGSYFGDAFLNGTALTLASNVKVERVFDFENGNPSLDFAGFELRVGDDWRLRSGASLVTPFVAGSKLIFDGDVEQTIFNEDDGNDYPPVDFDGVGKKELTGEGFDVLGNVNIGSSCALDANGEYITLTGNWKNPGTFQHGNGGMVQFLGNGTTVSTSTFSNLVIGNGVDPITVTLTGNIQVFEELAIAQNATLDVSVSNYDISVEDEWRSMGTFVAREGTVFFIGGGGQVYTDGGTALGNHAFYNLVLNKTEFQDLNLRSNGGTATRTYAGGKFVLGPHYDGLVDNALYVLNDLTVESGDFRLNDNGNAVDNTLYIGGSLTVEDAGTFDYVDGGSLVVFNGTSGTHTIDNAISPMRDWEINAPGATYQLGDNLTMDDNSAYAFELKDGTFDHNGFTFTGGNGGISQSGGTWIVDEGAVLAVDGDQVFTKSAGNLQIIGVDGNPATFSAKNEGSNDYFAFEQSGGSFLANYYLVSGTSDNGTTRRGLNFTGGTISSLSDGTFTAGTGTAYLNLSAGITFDTGSGPTAINANNVVFNSGPTNNIATTGITETATNTNVTFVIAGGTLAGEDYETDIPDGGASDGYFRWQFPPGLYWTGAADSRWNNAANWSDPSNIDADDIPDADDKVYIRIADVIGSSTPTINAASGSASIERLTMIGAVTLNVLEDQTLSIANNISIGTGATLAVEDNETINVGSSWANAGTFNENVGTVVFNGTSGSHTITTRGTTDPFYNLTINAPGALYAIGSTIETNGALTISGGTLDASSSNPIYLNGDWTVNGGTFEPGGGTVYWDGDGVSGDQTITSGTFYLVQTRNAGNKVLGANVSIAGELRMNDGGGALQLNGKTLFVGGNWRNDNSNPAGGGNSFDAQNGTVVFNGAGGQTIGSGSAGTDFHRVIIQGSGNKTVGQNMTLTDNLSIVSSSANFIIPVGVTVTCTGGAGKSLAMTGGAMYVRDANNFPSGFTNYNLSAGTVYYESDSPQTVQGGITYYDLRLIRATNDAATPITKTLGGNITVLNTLNLTNNNRPVIFNVDGHIITLGNTITIDSNHSFDWTSGGTLIHTGDNWGLDTDLTDFFNLTLSGTGTKTVSSNLTIFGDLTIDDNVSLNINNGVTIDGDVANTLIASNTMTMEEGSFFFSDSQDANGAIPYGFETYALNANSTIRFDATGGGVNQYLPVNDHQGDQIVYGNLQIYNEGNTNIINGAGGAGGTLNVDGDFIMDNDPTLIDIEAGNTFDLLMGGNTVDLRDFTPSTGTTLTLDRAGDQLLADYDGTSGVPLLLENVVFSGNGTKTINTNNGNNDYVQVNGNLTINPNVTLFLQYEDFIFDGTNFTNNGTFDADTNGNNDYPVVFRGDQATGTLQIDPGVNTIYSIQFSNTNQVQIINNGFDIGNGTFTVNGTENVDFGNGLNHTIASNVFSLAVGFWQTSQANINFDRNGNQDLPANLVVNNATFSTGGTKILTTDITINGDLLINQVNLDANNTGNYNITLYGNWTNSGGQFFDRLGTVFFESDAADDGQTKTIAANGHSFYNATFHNLGGSQAFTVNFELSENTDIAEVFTANQGATIDLNGKTLQLGDNDANRPPGEIHVINTGATVLVDAGATLGFDASDDNDGNSEVGATLNVFGHLAIVGSSTEAATLTRLNGGDRIDVNIESGGRISAKNYLIQYLTDEGLEIKSGAFIGGYGGDNDTNFSFGTFSELETGTSANLDTDPDLLADGTDGDGNFTNDGSRVKRYLWISTDAANFSNSTIQSVTFNLAGSPNNNGFGDAIYGDAAAPDNILVSGSPAYHQVNVRYQGTGTIRFEQINGVLGAEGYLYEEEVNTPAITGNIEWEAPSTNTWQGTVSIDWTNGANWSLGVVPDLTNTAVIPLGNPFNPTIPASSPDINIGGLQITTGILKLGNNTILNIEGDIQIGTADGAALVVLGPAAIIEVENNWSIDNGAIFDNGLGTVQFDNPSGRTAVIAPGNQAFYNVNFRRDVGAEAAGIFQISGNYWDIDGKLTITDAATVVPLTGGYEFYASGDIELSGGAVFDTQTANGEFRLDGGAQTITDMVFRDLIAEGTGIKTMAGTTVTVEDDFIIRAGVKVLGNSDLDMNGNVTIYEAGGAIQGVNGKFYYFGGNDWIAGSGSYENTEGTVVFDRTGNQWIRQIGADPVEFHNLTLSGTGRIYLGRLVNFTQVAGNINMTGDLTVNNSINWLWCDQYKITGDGSGTFTLAAGEYIDVRGADNFPDNFSSYQLNATSFTRYYGTGDQVIRGRTNGSEPTVSYGNLYLNSPSRKTLEGAIDINGDLYINDAILDVSTSNYTINIAGRWNNRNDGGQGEFEARGGTVVFDGTTNQIINIGLSGKQDFYNLTVNKDAGEAGIYGNEVTINNNLIVQGGTFNARGFQVTIRGNMVATNDGQFESFAWGNSSYVLVGQGTNTTFTLNGNGSEIDGSLEINAPNRTYKLGGDFGLLEDFTITAGTFNLNGYTFNAGNYSDNVTVFGNLEVSTSYKTGFNPGGTLKLGNDCQLVVKPGGSVAIVGTASNVATVTRNDSFGGRYAFTLTGTSGTPGRILAEYYLFEYMNGDGIFVNELSLIDNTYNFSNGTFNNGESGGRYLRIENTQTLSGANKIENVSFPFDPLNGASNVYKTTKTTGEIVFSNYLGDFSGEFFDEDPNNLITWEAPAVVYWTGAVDSDWFDPLNWSPVGVPGATTNVIIPQTLNEPIIDDTGTAEINNLTLELNAILKLNSTDLYNNDGEASADLIVHGDLNFDVASTLEFASTTAEADVMAVAGNWNKQNSSLFTPGEGRVVLTSVAGIKTLDNGNDAFYDLESRISGTLQLGNDIRVLNDFVNTSGTFSTNNNDMTIGGTFTNAGTFQEGTSTIKLIPTNTSGRTLTMGGAKFYNLEMGALSGNQAVFTQADNLRVTHDFRLYAGELDLNNFDLTLGNDNGIQDDLEIYGTLQIDANEVLYLGGDASVQVKEGGVFKLIGTDADNRARVTRSPSSTGYYDFTVNGDAVTDATIEAIYYSFQYMGTDGIVIGPNATITPNAAVDLVPVGALDGSNENTALDYGIFANSNGTRYLNIDDNLADEGTLYARGVSFGEGPTFNVRKTSSSVNPIVFYDAYGITAGRFFEENDDNDFTGNIQWVYSQDLYTWVGDVDTNWGDRLNWSSSTEGDNPSTAPQVGDFVEIPAGVPNNPFIEPGDYNNGGDLTIAGLTMFTGSQLTISDNVVMIVNGALSNDGDIIIQTGVTGTTLEVAGEWSNSGTFDPGNSTITLTTPSGIDFSGGVRFYNLTINTPSSVVLFGQADLQVANDLNITSGIYQASTGQTIDVGGSFTVGANGRFVHGGDINDSPVTAGAEVILSGTGQIIIGSAPAQSPFYDLTIGNGTNTASVSTPGSGQTIYVEKDIEINGNATFSLGATDQLEVQGNWTNDGSFSANATSTVVFNGTTPQNIGGSNDLSFGNLTFNNTDNSTFTFILGRKVEVATSLNLYDGIIVPNSDSEPLVVKQNCTIDYIEGAGTGTATDEAGGVYTNDCYVNGTMAAENKTNFVFPIGQDAIYQPIGYAGGGTSATYSARYQSSSFPGTNPLANLDPDPSNGELTNVSVLEYWDFSLFSGTAGSPIMTLFWSDSSRSELTADDVAADKNICNLVVTHYNSVSGIWENLGNGEATCDGSVTIGPTGSITAASQLTSFSPITFGSIATPFVNPLPVVLTSFTGSLNNEKVELQWETASETNNDRFEIERSPDGSNFEKIGEVKGVGNSLTLQRYGFDDLNPLPGVNYYRLKQADMDGTYEYSQVIAVEADGLALSAKVNIFPNPNKERKLTLQISDYTSPTVELNLYNLQGQRLFTQTFKEESQWKKGVEVNLPFYLSKGVYFIKVEGNNLVQSSKLILE